jgi:hypothetical protein
MKLFSLFNCIMTMKNLISLIFTVLEIQEVFKSK